MSIEKFNKQENVGVVLIVVGLLGFFLFMWLFELFGARPSFPQDLPKLILPLLSIFIGIGGIGYTVSGKRGAINALLIFTFLLFVAVVAGLIIGATNDLNAL